MKTLNWKKKVAAAAMCNTKESAEKQSDVCAAVDREMQLRAELEQVKRERDKLRVQITACSRVACGEPAETVHSPFIALDDVERLRLELSASQSREKEAVALAAAYRDELEEAVDGMATMVDDLQNCFDERCVPTSGEVGSAIAYLNGARKTLSLPTPAALKRFEAMERALREIKSNKNVIGWLYAGQIAEKALAALAEIEKEMKG